MLLVQVPYAAVIRWRLEQDAKKTACNIWDHSQFYHCLTLEAPAQEVLPLPFI